MLHRPAAGGSSGRGGGCERRPPRPGPMAVLGELARDEGWRDVKAAHQPPTGHVAAPAEKTWQWRSLPAAGPSRLPATGPSGRASAQRPSLNTRGQWLGARREPPSFPWLVAWPGARTVPHQLVGTERDVLRYGATARGFARAPRGPVNSIYKGEAPAGGRAGNVQALGMTASGCRSRLGFAVVLRGSGPS